MFELYTERARRAVFYARYQASMSGMGQIEAEHLLLGVLHEDRDLSRGIFDDAETMRRDLLARLPPAQDRIPTSADMPLSTACKHAMDRALSEARGLGNPHIGCEHLLLALIQETGSPAAEVLRSHGMELERLRAQPRAGPHRREDKSQPPSTRVCQPAPRPGDLLELDGGILQIESTSVHRDANGVRLELRLRRVP